MLASDHSQCRGLLSARQNGSPQPMDNPASGGHLAIPKLMPHSIGAWEGFWSQPRSARKMLKSWKRTQLTPLVSVKSQKNELKTNSKTTRKARSKQPRSCKSILDMEPGARLRKLSPFGLGSKTAASLPHSRGAWEEF